jgi:hypothetical protein
MLAQCSQKKDTNVLYLSFAGACCLLPAACCLLPAACCLLPGTLSVFGLCRESENAYPFPSLLLSYVPKMLPITANIVKSVRISRK